MSRRIALMELHGAVALFGLAGVIGKSMTSGAIVTVLGRSAIAALVLGLGMAIVGRRLSLPANDRPGMLWSGALLAAHWLAFFHAISLSSVAIGVVGFATFPLFVTLIAPLVGGPRLRGIDAITALGVLGGLTLIASPSNTAAYGGALALAVFSGFLFALLTILNRRLVSRQPFLLVAFFQQAGAAVILLPFALALGAAPQAGDFWLIAVLGIICTALAQTLFVKSLANVEAQLASVVTGLEPVYAIALAAVLIHEVPDMLTLLGVGLVLATVTAATLMAPRATRH
ncbi:MAG: DMT family transporter [Lysobacterales bacterium]